MVIEKSHMLQGLSRHRVYTIIIYTIFTIQNSLLIGYEGDASYSQAITSLKTKIQYFRLVFKQNLILEVRCSCIWKIYWLEDIFQYYKTLKSQTLKLSNIKYFIPRSYTFRISLQICKVVLSCNRINTMSEHNLLVSKCQHLQP